MLLLQTLILGNHETDPENITCNDTRCEVAGEHLWTQLSQLKVTSSETGVNANSHTLEDKT